MKNKSRFKSLHYEDQVRLMKEYKKYGTFPFKRMKNDFRRMASHYQYVEKRDILPRSIITKKKWAWKMNVLHALKAHQGLTLCNLI